MTFGGSNLGVGLGQQFGKDRLLLLLIGEVASCGLHLGMMAFEGRDTRGNSNLEDFLERSDAILQIVDTIREVFVIVLEVFVTAFEVFVTVCEVYKTHGRAFFFLEKLFVAIFEGGKTLHDRLDIASHLDARFRLDFLSIFHGADFDSLVVLDGISEHLLDLLVGDGRKNGAYQLLLRFSASGRRGLFSALLTVDTSE